MLIPLLFLAAVAPQPDTEPVIVTGHAWAPFISPMGEPFRARSASDDTLARWFAGADRDHDGALTPAELQRDAERFFATLDTSPDGEIDPDELVAYEWEIAPDVQLMARAKRAPGDPAPKADSRRRSWLMTNDDYELLKDKPRRGRREEGLEGAARYGLLNMPEPVAAADADFNRGVTLDEFRQAALARFALLDSTRDGRLLLNELEARRSALLASGKRRKDDKRPDPRIGTPLPPHN